MTVYANVVVDIIGLIIVIVVMVADRLMIMPKMNIRRLFRALLWLVAGVLLFDIPAWLLDGRVFPGARELCYVLDTLYYVCQILYCYFWLLFSDDWNRISKDGFIRHKWVYTLPLIIELAVIAINPFTGWIFHINEDNVYYRGTYYLANLVPYYLYIVYSLVFSLKGFFDAREPERKRQCLALSVFMSLPICGVALETVSYGMSWIWPFSALSLLMVYLSVQQQQASEQRMVALKQSEEAALLKNELTNSRIAIMLSQMQPHFLYNALSSIKALCTRDPKLAAQAAGDFSDFLRNNVDSLSADKPVSFPMELEHTKHYLALEQIRFRDRLNVRYDIQTDLFRLPTLTLQPIVENAVRYGIMQRIEGGTVTISTEERPDAFAVTVRDDGVGFDPMQTKTDGRSHIGIQNVNDRLKAMCGGTLTITSTPDVGTVAVMTIPKTQTPGDTAC